MYTGTRYVSRSECVRVGGRYVMRFGIYDTYNNIDVSDVELFDTREQSDSVALAMNESIFTSA